MKKRVYAVTEQEAYFKEHTRADKPIKYWEGKKKPTVPEPEVSHPKLPRTKGCTFKKEYKGFIFHCVHCSKPYINWKKHKEVCVTKPDATLPCKVCGDPAVNVWRWSEHVKFFHHTPPAKRQKTQQAPIIGFTGKETCMCGATNVENPLEHRCDAVDYWALGMEGRESLANLFAGRSTTKVNGQEKQTREVLEEDILKEKEKEEKAEQKEKLAMKRAMRAYNIERLGS